MTDNNDRALKLKAVALNATPGKWSYARSGFNSIVQAPVNMVRGGASRVMVCALKRAGWLGELATATDAAFIAEANPENILSLLAERDADKKRIEMLEKYVDERDAQNQELLLNIGSLQQRIDELEARSVSVKPAEEYPDDFDLQAAINLNDEYADYQTAQWLKELRLRRGAMQAEPVTAAAVPEEKGSSLQLRNLIRQRHAEWSEKTFGNIGPVGPLKHLAKEAIEAAEAPEDLSEWADMQFLLWDAQRRAGISDAEITAAMEEKLKVNMARQWPEPKDGEPRLHIKASPEQEV